MAYLEQHPSLLSMQGAHSFASGSRGDLRVCTLGKRAQGVNMLHYCRRLFALASDNGSMSPGLLKNPSAIFLHLFFWVTACWIPHRDEHFSSPPSPLSSPSAFGFTHTHTRTHAHTFDVADLRVQAFFCALLTLIILIVVALYHALHDEGTWPLCLL
jgi:hypothetical protein